MIRLLGMGLLGSNFARALRKRGEQVRVWNRTAEKARALAAVGAASARTWHAVRGATRVHLTLSDDAAVDDVLERARPGFARRGHRRSHDDLADRRARARGALGERGVAFQHAPVFMGPQNALESTGIMLVSGDRARVERAARPRSRR